MKLALIHDWFDKYGGAERVINSIDKCMSFDYYFAYADIMKKKDKLIMFNGKNPEINTSYLLKFLGNKFRFALPFFPLVTKNFNSQNRKKYSVDLVISSSWCLSKGFRIGNETHICYIQARNFKYVWDEYDNYFPGILGLIFLPFRKYLQRFDKKMAKNPDYIIANSIYVQNWIEKNYKVKSSVIYPPVSIENFNLRTINISDSEYYVTVGRLVKYKRFDLLVKAFIKLNKKLIVIGDGPEKSKLEQSAKNSDKIIFTGYLSSTEINNYITNAKAFVFSSLEDFGIAPVEAQACGTPVIAYGKGGVLETIIEGKTGVFFYKQQVENIIEAVENFEKNIKDFNPIVIRENSKKFSEEVFIKKLNLFVEENIS
ncbi:GDP-mannose-dependent alpha-(1-6)-phosphatidylinositol monomannoside mannosyltransferase [Chryseobacterium sp. MOF25P]|uniref:glycosyltransferase n=1 Tax=unclassified Chryseobacterium TaxID=2593645 RepID=UPI000805F92C|nr:MULTISPECIES: glycosyltransferase [unclassified Chryseobacterium]OBW39945.1 GDP-mannose-dependent alpha-(1-6)-phosphatidylinositol monomannoside mannosyltransferase [Chryseobacterium sp. MOF25P]OBW43672.1 GDP-mannose-dependent alpha-(1-6)-phosphatidylinositol monomannoside mannosyltransferase [Chryseobacterium sp. BGARF1]